MEDISGQSRPYSEKSSIHVRGKVANFRRNHLELEDYTSIDSESKEEERCLAGRRSAQLDDKGGNG
jgi:hypothetical protein